MTCPLPFNAFRLVAIWHHLAEHGPASAADLAAATRCSVKALRVAIAAGRKQYPGVFRIAKWVRQTAEQGLRGGGAIALYDLGHKPDAPRPKSLTNAERTRAHYRRHSARERVRARASRARAAGKTFDPWAFMITQLAPRKSPRRAEP